MSDRSPRCIRCARSRRMRQTGDETPSTNPLSNGGAERTSQTVESQGAGVSSGSAIAGG